MNIMLVSVTERTREIGIRMAVGARGAQISMQFLVEALTLALLGGLIGLGLGLGITWIISSLGNSVVFAAGPVIMVFGCAFLTGLIFGYVPARKAAQLDPVQALASE